jgi:hypothetical protein
MNKNKNNTYQYDKPWYSKQRCKWEHSKTSEFFMSKFCKKKKTEIKAWMTLQQVSFKKEVTVPTEQY